jgi:Flp pilus assembly pilin Flp
VFSTHRNRRMSKLAAYSVRTARKFGQLLADERAATAIEYALIAAGVGSAIAATVYGLGTAVRDSLYQKVSDSL